MRKNWDIGNTTVRNPRRIERALAVFLKEGFSGNIDSNKRQADFVDKLEEKGVLEYKNNALETKEINGRKWRSALYQLGFISGDNYIINGVKKECKEILAQINLKHFLPFQITPTGEKLLEASSIPEIEEIYLRQMINYELPNALETDFPNDKKLKPFILFLQVLNRLDQKNEPGLNKLETELFIQKFSDHTPTLAENIVDNILRFRSDLYKKPSKQQKELIQTYLGSLYQEVELNMASRSLRDYADTTFRYFTLSGLFTRSQDKMIIRNNKKRLVQKLLETEPDFLHHSDFKKYFEAYYFNSYPVPTDDIDFALYEISLLNAEIKDRNNTLFKESKALNKSSDKELIRNIRFKLIEYNNWEREEDYAHAQKEEDNIKEIITYLKALNQENIKNAPDIDDKPAYLEWAVWRSFLAINEIICEIHKTRRFPIDQDFLPRNTAPGGGSDLIIEFEAYVLAVELTLTISNRQMAVESEPVRRHTAAYKEQYPDKDVYCLFIAPRIDNNVAETFRIGVWYKGDLEEFVNIIPFSLADFIQVIEILLQKKFTNLDFRNLLDRCLIYRNLTAPNWKKIISKEINRWKNQMLKAQSSI